MLNRLSQAKPKLSNFIPFCLIFKKIEFMPIIKCCKGYWLLTLIKPIKEYCKIGYFFKYRVPYVNFISISFQMLARRLDFSTLPGYIYISVVQQGMIRISPWHSVNFLCLARILQLGKYIVSFRLIGLHAFCGLTAFYGFFYLGGARLRKFGLASLLYISRLRWWLGCRQRGLNGAKSKNYCDRASRGISSCISSCISSSISSSSSLSSSYKIICQVYNQLDNQSCYYIIVQTQSSPNQIKQYFYEGIESCLFQMISFNSYLRYDLFRTLQSNSPYLRWTSI